MKKLNLLDEGSWALMIEESNVRALHKYHGSMARLDIDYYLSIGTNRYYKAYFEAAGLARVREGIVRFLLDEDTYKRCISGIYDVLERMRNSDEAFAGLALSEQFELYCNLLCEYIAYYNSVITDTFYANVFDLVDSELPPDTRFAAKAIKDSLFATNNNELLTHLQTVDMLAMSQQHLSGQSVDEEIERFVEKYRSTTISSGSPNGITPTEVKDHLSQQTPTSVQLEKAFLDNLHFRYSHAEAWSERTASAINLSEETRLLIRHTCELSYLKILMREEFQKFKVTTRSRFLNGLIKEIGKQQFDYMLIDEIADFIRYGRRVSDAEISRRQKLVIFELAEGAISFSGVVPQGIEIESGRDSSRNELSGDVLIGAGSKKYRVKKVEQHEEGLNSFDEFIEATEAKEDVAVITNVLRPYLVPKLRKFGALVTQYGGYTSHASVLCRELGISSMINVPGLLDSLETNDHIEIDFDRGTIRRLDDVSLSESAANKIVVNLDEESGYATREIGAKAANLMKINKSARIAEGFVITSHALRNIDDEDVRQVILERLASMKCDRIVIRSSHESEDSSTGSYAGLFESYVDVDVSDSDNVIELARSVYRSQQANSIDKYGKAEGDMSAIVQEMISADVSGVILTSNSFNGYDYMLLEYVVGDLCHLMQGDVTPLISYIRKVDIIDDSESYCAYPAIITEPLAGLFKSLMKIAVDLENQFSRRVQIEWGIRNETIYIFQVRPY
ncbi:PEP/pyruvate-binding domain-containing protein [Streptacidiphilus griseoplanus]|uniref:PEP/pyruvate-binding domain-containing protein n=1 Tax=Peterkaempfera griseoplana TaxID=66896 RepID=UPI00146FFA7C|nr:PEP/pyruvate-binding domain-containing protein [Peterkaempfera griseoplana]